MCHSNKRRLAPWIVCLGLFAVLMTACRVEEAPSSAGLQPVLPQPTQQSSVLSPSPSQQAGISITQHTPVPTIATGPARPSPTVLVRVGPTDLPSPAAELTLTILHTGEVQGETDPCG